MFNICEILSLKYKSNFLHFKISSISFIKSALGLAEIFSDMSLELLNYSLIKFYLAWFSNNCNMSLSRRLKIFSFILE